MKRVIKNTATQAVVKIQGSNVTELIQFEQNLATTNQIVISDQQVGIQFIQWQISSAAGDRVEITRGGELIAVLNQNQGEMELSGNNGIRDDINSLDDIQVQIIGTAVVYMTLRKIRGFQDINGNNIDISYYPLDFGWIEVF